MPEKPCEWAENPSGSVWECTAHNTQCAHKHADTNPDGSVNIFECRLGDPAYAFREIKRLQRLAQSYADTINKLIAVINNMNGAKTATQLNHVMDNFDAITAPIAAPKPKAERTCYNCKHGGYGFDSDLGCNLWHRGKADPETCEYWEGAKDGKND